MDKKKVAKPRKTCKPAGMAAAAGRNKRLLQLEPAPSGLIQKKSSVAAATKRKQNDGVPTKRSRKNADEQGGTGKIKVDKGQKI